MILMLKIQLKKLMPTKKTGAKKKKKSRMQHRLKSKKNFSNRSLLLFVLVFAAVGGYILWKSFAAPAPPTVYLNGAPSFVAPNANFTVQVRENSGTTGVNAVEADISYPTALVSFVSISYTGTAFGYNVQSSGGSGAVNIATGLNCSTTCPAAPTGDQLVATITFKALTSSGAAALAFTTGTSLVSASTNQNLLSSLAATGGATVNVDATAPTVSVTAPANNATLSGGTTVNITTNAADGGSGIQKVEFYIDAALVSTVSASPYNYSWNTAGKTLAAHTIQAKAYDNSGNLTSSSIVNVTLADQTAPTAPGSFRVTGTGLTTVSLAWNASTDNVAVTGYKITRDGTLITATPLTPATLIYNDSALATSTTYNYTVFAVDAAGNSSPVSSVSATTSTVTSGDLNLDGHVNGADLAILAANYKTANAVADVNHDNIVDIVDLSLLLSHYTG
jgi:hypothetical protein